MSNIKWARAKSLLSNFYVNADPNEARNQNKFPLRMLVTEIAILQEPPKKIPETGRMQYFTHDWDETRNIITAINTAVDAGELPSVSQVYKYVAPYQRKPVSEDRTFPTISAADFHHWLKTQGEKPSEHIQAWFDAYGVSQEAAPTVNAAPVSAGSSANEKPNNLDKVEWTPELLKEKRDAFQGDGKGKPMQRLVEASGIKERTIRRLIAKNREPEINPNSLFQFSPRQNAGHRRA
ncbi:MAG: hypothetical protein IPH35_13695 [Rhodoferax sp.]|nr:hypothetical protein [Rhodoferax sp.]